MKIIRKILTSVVLVIVGMVLATSYLHAEGYINWKGTPQYRNTVDNASKIKMYISDIQEDNLELHNKLEESSEDLIYYVDRVEVLEKAYNELNNLLYGRDKTILELQETIEQRDNTILELQSLIEIIEQENEQAFLDMSHVDELIQNIVDGL